MPLSFHKHANDVHQLLNAAIEAANPATAVSHHLHKQNNTITIGDQKYNLKNGRLFLIGIGKAALLMTQAALTILGDSIYAGICLSKENEPLQRPDLPPNIQFYTGEHPISSKKSVAATTAVFQLLTQTTSDDLVICLISGGCSALLTQPIIPLADWQTLNNALLASGCPINEFNSVRRHLDRAKGGGLARWAAPAPVATLILSDVIGNDLHTIGSGPTVFNEENGVEATAVLHKYHIPQKLPKRTWATIQTQLQNSRTVPPETAVQNKIIGDVRLAAQAMAQKATELGFQTTILTTHLQGEAQEVGRFVAALAQDAPPSSCLIFGGETTVTLHGDGLGSRNLEVALSAAIQIENVPNIVIFTLATDGDDGSTECAGAIVSGESVGYGRKQALNAQAHLDNNDSYTYLQQLPNHLIITGPTGTNVNDLICILTYPS